MRLRQRLGSGSGGERRGEGLMLMYLGDSEGREGGERTRGRGVMHEGQWVAFSHSIR